MMRLTRDASPLAMLLSGFVLWSLAFVVLYGMQATGCHFGWHTMLLAGAVTVQRAVLVGLFLVFVAFHVVLYVVLLRAVANGTAARDEPEGFSREAGLHLALAAFGAAIFCFSGVFWLSAC
ncbi:MAG: hypothetical protein AB7O80_14865 [Acetobacteraceae bacterium]